MYEDQWDYIEKQLGELGMPHPEMAVARMMEAGYDPTKNVAALASRYAFDFRRQLIEAEKKKKRPSWYRGVARTAANIGATVAMGVLTGAAVSTGQHYGPAAAYKAYNWARRKGSAVRAGLAALRRNRTKNVYGAGGPGARPRYR